MPAVQVCTTSIGSDSWTPGSNRGGDRWDVWKYTQAATSNAFSSKPGNTDEQGGLQAKAKQLDNLQTRANRGVDITNLDLDLLMSKFLQNLNLQQTSQLKSLMWAKIPFTLEKNKSQTRRRPKIKP